MQSSRQPTSAASKPDGGLSASNLTQLERNALDSQVLSRMVLDYYANGSDGQITVQDNQTAYSRYKFLPRMLRDVSDVRPSTHVLGALRPFYSAVDRSKALHEVLSRAGVRFILRGSTAAQHNCSPETLVPFPEARWY